MNYITLHDLIQSEVIKGTDNKIQRNIRNILLKHNLEINGRQKVMNIFI